MTSLVQGLKQAFSDLNRGMITQVYPFLKGRAVEFLSAASIHMRQSMSTPFTTPYTAILTANTLFYAFFSCTVHCLESHSDRSDPTHKQKTIYSLKSVVILGTLTALFNVCIFRLAHQQLNRLALFTMTAAIVDWHILFSSVSAYLRNRGTSVSPLTYKMPLPSSFSIKLEGTPFTQDDLEYLIRSIEVQDYVDLLSRFQQNFIQGIKDLSTNSALAHLETVEGRRNCLDSMIRTFNERLEGRWVNDENANNIFRRVLEEHIEKLSANQTVIWQGIQQTQDDLKKDESYRILTEMGFNGEQLARLVRIATVDGSALLASIVSNIKSSHLAIPQTDQNKRFLLDIVISAYKMNSAMASDVSSASTTINLSLYGVRDGNERRRSKNNAPISEAHERLLLLRINPNELASIDDACFDVVDEYLRHLFTFIEPYEFKGVKRTNFVSEVSRMSSTISNLKEYLFCRLYCEQLEYFGFTDAMLENFSERLQIKSGHVVQMLNGCLYEYYTDKKVLPGPNVQEIQKFLDYIITQFYRGLPVDRELEKTENFVLMKRIVDYAIAHPEVFRNHKLFPGEPGYVGLRYFYFPTSR